MAPRKTRKTTKDQNNNEEEEVQSKRRRLEELERERREILESLPSTSSNPPESHTPNSAPVSNPIINDTTVTTDTLNELLKQITKGLDKNHSKNYPPLPTFYGDLENWELFLTDYLTSTKDYNIPVHANMKRLENALRGEAYKSVKQYLGRPNCLDMVIEELNTKFGPDADITNTVLNKCDNLPRLDRDLKNLRDFTIEVMSMGTTIERSGIAGLGTLVVDNLQRKLDNAARIDWGKRQIKMKSSTYETFITWLKSYRDALQIAGGLQDYNRHRSNPHLRKKQERDRSTLPRSRSPSRNREYDREKEGYNSDYNRRGKSRSDHRDRSEDRDRRYNKYYSRHNEEPSSFINSRNPNYNPESNRVMITKPIKEDSCEMNCNTEHSLLNCPKFKNLNTPQQFEMVFKMRRCYKCMNKHNFRNCPNNSEQKP